MHQVAVLQLLAEFGRLGAPDTKGTSWARRNEVTWCNHPDHCHRPFMELPGKRKGNSGKSTSNMPNLFIGVKMVGIETISTVFLWDMIHIVII